MKLKDSDISWLPVEEQVLVLDLRTSRYSSLNEAAARLWTVLAAGGDVEDLVATLRGDYGVTGPQAEHDVAAFLDGLRQRDLLDEAV